MLGNFGRTDWDLPKDSGGDGSGDGGKLSENERLYKFRFRMPDASKNELEVGRPVTRRVLFLNETPFSYYEHGLYKIDLGNHYTALCLKKNNLDERGCPLCDPKGGNVWPAYVGLFGIIDMGQVEYNGSDAILHHRKWTDKEGNEQLDSFPRKVLCAKMGSKKKPGVLKHLLWNAERHGGSLEGTIWDTTRSGEMEANIGESWEFVERISPDDYVNYLVGLGADSERLNVDQISTEQWYDICQPLTYEEMANAVGLGEKPKSGANGSSTSGAGYGKVDDDIPF